MKVGINQTIEISDDQRMALAKRLRGDNAVGNRVMATRDEIKDFCWEHGEKWAEYLAGPQPVPAAPDPEALLGMGDLSEYGSEEEVAEVVDDLLGGGTATEDPMSLL